MDIYSIRDAPRKKGICRKKFLQEIFLASSASLIFIYSLYLIVQCLQDHLKAENNFVAKLKSGHRNYTDINKRIREEISHMNIPAEHLHLTRQITTRETETNENALEPYYSWTSDEFHTPVFVQPESSQFMKACAYATLVQATTTLKPNFRTFYDYNVKFALNAQNKCNKAPFLVFLIRSELKNFDLRSAIRQTWGSEDIHWSMSVRRVFLLGKNDEDRRMQPLIDHEARMNADIAQVDYQEDSCYLSVLLMSGLLWANTYCQRASYFLLVDDDALLNVKNLLKLLKHREAFSKHIAGPESADLPHMFRLDELQENSATEKQEPLVYAGCVLNTTLPIRIPNAKRFVPASDFPYDMYPPHVSSCSVLVSQATVAPLLKAARHTRLIGVDDVYLGLVALGAKISPSHIQGVYGGGLLLSQPQDVLQYPELVVDHRYTADRMFNVWAVLQQQQEVMNLSALPQGQFKAKTSRTIKYIDA